MFDAAGGCPRENRIYQYSIADPSPDAVCKMSPDTNTLMAELGPPSSSFMCKVGSSFVNLIAFCIIIVPSRHLTLIDLHVQGCADVLCSSCHVYICALLEL